MMIRDPIRAFHDAIAMPSMAPIVVERPTHSDAVARSEARTSVHLGAFERHVVRFATAARTLIDTLRDAERGIADDADRVELSDFIDYVERMAERMAIDGARTEKDMLRDAGGQEKQDPGLAAAHRTSALRLAELNAQTVETLLALALDLRALRSSLLPSNRKHHSPESLSNKGLRRSGTRHPSLIGRMSYYSRSIGNATARRV